MLISQGLRKKIIKKIDSSESKYFTHTLYDDLLGNEYIMDGKPTEKLIFLSFDEFDNLIDTFLNRYREKYKYLPRYFREKRIKYFLSPKNLNSLKINFVERNIKKEKDKFSKKFIILFDIIRDCCGENLQKENQIIICPYCQKNYVNIINYRDKDNNYKSSKPDLDHFYAKTIYPFLACSIENLIPSCQFCNQRLKQTKDFFSEKHIHPLKENMIEKLKFNYLDNDIYIENTNRLSQEERNYILTFKIQEQYAFHTEVLSDLKIKFNKYNRVKKHHLVNCCPTLKESLIEDMVFHDYKYIDKVKQPLWKLKKDLYKRIKKEST